METISWHVGQDINCMIWEVLWLIRQWLDVHKHGSHNKHYPFTVFKSVSAISIRQIYCDVKHCFQDFCRHANLILWHGVSHWTFLNLGPLKELQVIIIMIITLHNTKCNCQLKKWLERKIIHLISGYEANNYLTVLEKKKKEANFVTREKTM